VNQFGEWQKFRSTLQDVHTDLSEQGKIHSDKLKGNAKLVYLWNRYKRVTVIAASIAGITAIALSSLVNSIAPQPKDPQVQQLVHQVSAVKQDLNNLKKNLDNADRTTQQPVQPIIPRFNGTGFLVNAKGLMITNAHVVKNSRNIFVQNIKGEQFKAIVVRLDVLKDVAFIKIDDERFKPSASLPYGFRHTPSDLAEPIFTLGFPRDEIVYGEGYLSAKTGFNGDTLSCQISIDANPGNSGGPVFNRNGEVIGILSTKEIAAEGAVFAVQSKYIYKALEELKSNSIYENVKVPAKSTLGGMEKIQQVKKIQEFVYMVKGD
jgi:S1-C subfamily serine protease